jgi:hypothetical protein
MYAIFIENGELIMQKLKLLSKIIILVSFSFLFLSCDDESYKTPPPIDGGDDGDVTDHINPTDEVDANPEGPVIIITNPTNMETVSGDFILIKATIASETSTVNYDAVTVFMEGETYTMTVDPGTQDGFMATVDLDDVPDGTSIIRVTATDIDGRTNFEDVTFNHDKGPSFVIYSPEDQSSYHGGTNISFMVSDNDGVPENLVEVYIGTVPITLVKEEESTVTENGNPTYIRFSADIIFDDSIFSPVLSGEERISFYATNSLNNSSSTFIDFFVDNTGPIIVVNSQIPGEIVGGIISIEADIQDKSGILNSSVYAIIGNNDLNYDIQLENIEGSSLYTGSFDTSILPHTFIWPVLQVFATDKLGNENSGAFALALDNSPPILSLDPPDNFRMARLNSDSLIECSHGFDPVGSKAANDKTLVPQVFWLRSRVEDTGNSADGMAWSPTALIDQDTVAIYILDDSSQSLIVDTNDDGICDEINPLLLPTIHLTGDPMETLKLNMVSIDPGGNADFTPYVGWPAPCETSGIDEDPPSRLCAGVNNDVYTIIFYTVDLTEPAIYGLPPYDSGSPLMCTGIQFDSLANNISEGWACIAVKGFDNAGNIGVSAPLRVCIDYDTTDGTTVPECNNLTLAPDCTGTLDNSTSPPTVLSNPCSPLLFSEDQVRRTD